MKVVDTSVAVAAFASWHESHERARATVAQGPGLVAHSALETYSVLTRLPEPHRVEGGHVAIFLEQAFGPPLTLDRRGQQRLVSRLSGAGVVGGAVYDGLIAMTVLRHDASLVTLDARAAQTYARCGVAYELLAT